MSDTEVVDVKTAMAADRAAYSRFVLALRDEGVLLPIQQGGAAFISNAHGGKDVDETLEACERIFMRLHQEDLP